MKLENAPGIGDTRWACSLLIQSVVPIKEVVGAGSSLRKRAAEVLEKWKGALDGREGTGGVAGTEADMFLQMVRGFGLKEKFDDEFLRKLVVEFANREDMPKTAVALGFGEKLVGIYLSGFFLVPICYKLLIFGCNENWHLLQFFQSSYRFLLKYII